MINSYHYMNNYHIIPSYYHTMNNDYPSFINFQCFHKDLICKSLNIYRKSTTFPIYLKWPFLLKYKCILSVYTIIFWILMRFYWEVGYVTFITYLLIIIKKVVDICLKCLTFYGWHRYLQYFNFFHFANKIH